MNRFRRHAAALLVAVALVLAGGALAQPPEVMNAAELQLALRKLTVVGNALYIAAHPDDENTAFLAWLARDRLVGAVYLSMTRGDGGQNLIGSEKGELVGLIRTQELLAARRIDGARQLFTRAIDFGYSKSPEETLRIWGKDEVLADTVFVIRKLRPDVIVTRFPTNGEGGHGQHTASALLAEEAFSAAGDPKRFPEQLKYVAPWQPKRLLWNVFRFGASAPRKEVPGRITVDLGAYNPLLGRSYTEIAAQSRSMHKSQGFGSAERRGTWLNDFQPRLGEAPKADLFEGIDLTWGRVPGGKPVGALLEEAARSFRPTDPSAVVPLLASAIAKMDALPPNPSILEKRQETLDAVRSCLGLWLEAIAAEESVAPGSDLKVSVAALNRSSVAVTLESIELPGAPALAPAAALKPNEPHKAELTLRIPADAPVTNPYWLEERPGAGLFTVKDPVLTGLAESRPPLVARFTVRVAGRPLVFETPVLFRSTDPVKGEVYRPFEVAPSVTIAFDEKLYLFGNGAPRRVRLTLLAGGANVSGTLRLNLPAGWKASPSEAPFELRAKGEEMAALFTVTPPAGESSATLAAEAVIGGAVVSQSVVHVDYPHIPEQTLFRPAEAKLVRLARSPGKKRIGYVMGSGDEIPEVLRQLGHEVTLLSDDDLEGADLSRFDAIVAGVRAYNTRPRLKPARRRLMEWVERGGTLVVQYNTAFELVTEEIGPYPFKISRDRVTVEEAPVTFTAPGHPLLSTPNRITGSDFDGWVQERGLYFASEKDKETWDPRYETPIACHDPGEPDKRGGLLFARHGKGTFVYTGYAFFRQLPAGVPGAIRLFENLLAAR